MSSVPKGTLESRLKRYWKLVAAQLGREELLLPTQFVLNAAIIIFINNLCLLLTLYMFRENTRNHLDLVKT